MATKVEVLEGELQQINADRAVLSERAKQVQRAIDAEHKLEKVRAMEPRERAELAQAIQAVGIESEESVNGGDQ